MRDTVGGLDLDRRDALRLGLASLISLPACRRRPRPKVAATRKAAPRSCVVIFMRGGIDAVFTTDPKRVSEVEPGVDVPYPESSILAPEGSGVRVGPHLAPILPSLSRMAILNGVRVHTANHETGAAQVIRMRTGVLPAMPSLLDVIGERRDGQPLACVSLGELNEHEHARRWFSEQQLRLLHDTPPDERLLLAQVMRKQAARLATKGKLALEHQATRENLEDAAKLLERTAALPRFEAVSWSGEQKTSPIPTSFQQALWLLENDLTKCVFMKAYLPWDTHERNTQGQETYSPSFFANLQRFFAELAARRNAHGLLADTTRVVLTSEVGRFPRLNGDQGKDHFPELPMMFYGPRLATHGGRGAVFGRTGRQMESLAIDPKTGRPGATAHPVRLDDVGATLLQSFGVAPEAHGYQGRVLDFLEMT